MTLEQFEMHRPKLYRGLSEFLAEHWDDPGTDVKEWNLGECDIEPSYWDGIRFIAKFDGLMRLCCLDDGTWAWEGDLWLA